MVYILILLFNDGLISDVNQRAIKYAYQICKLIKQIFQCLLVLYIRLFISQTYYFLWYVLNT